MLGIQYFRAAPTHYVMQFRGGRVRREGTGLSFFYLAPASTIVSVPVGSSDVPFMFQEASRDFQAVSVQGHLSFRVADPHKLVALLDYSLAAGGYASDDPTRLPQRIAHAAQTLTRAEIQARPLREVLVAADAIAERAHAALRDDPALAALGVEVLSLSLLAIRPVPDTARALEAETRERLLREADDAIYARRNNAVEQERRIRENELATEVAVEARRREVDETRLQAQIALEQSRRELVAAQAENTKTLAEAQGLATEAALRPIKALDPKALQMLAAGSADPRPLMALAFQELAANAAKVGNLNISPELLQGLLRTQEG